MLVKLDNYNELKKDFVKDRYTDYEIGICIAKKFTPAWTVCNIGLQYINSIEVYKPFFKKIYGFEPDYSYETILAHVNKQKYENVKLYNIALGKCQENRAFWYLSKKDRSRTAIDPITYLGACGFNVDPNQKYNDVTFDKRTIRTQTLDNIVYKDRIKNIDLLKIDAEKEDSRILMGSKKTIDRWRPVIQIETVDPYAKDWLISKNYVEAEFEDYVYEKNKKLDYWFIPKERINED